MLLKKLKARHDAMANTKLPPEEVAKLIKAGAFLVDVRPKIEAKMGMAPGRDEHPLLTLKRRLDELPRDRKIVLYCGTRAPRPERPRKFWMPRDSRRSTAAATRTS